MITAPTLWLNGWFCIKMTCSTLGGYIWQIITNPVRLTCWNTFKGPIQLTNGCISPGEMLPFMSAPWAHHTSANINIQFLYINKARFYSVFKMPTSSLLQCHIKLDNTKTQDMTVQIFKNLLNASIHICVQKKDHYITWNFYSTQTFHDETVKELN